MAITSYAEFQAFMIGVLTANVSESTGNTEESDAENNAPHGAFWKTMSYTDFTNGSVFGLQLVEKGNSANSNIIKALQGAPPFDGSTFMRMPADGPPYFTDPQIAEVAGWIDAGCPE